MKTQLSVLALAVAASTTAFAASSDEKDIQLTSAKDDVSVVVNSDSQNVGAFLVHNGEGDKRVTTLESHKDHTVIRARDRDTGAINTITLDAKGAHLSNIKLDGVADGKVEAGSTEAINGSQLAASQADAKAALAKEKAEREAAIAKEKAEREEADLVLQGNIDKERAERIEADDVLLDLLAGEESARIKGDRETLAAANAYTDQRINKVEKNYKAAVAAGIAIASLPQPTTAGKNMFSIGAGTWESEQGYALGVSGVTADNKWIYKVAASGDSRGNFGGGASVGFQW